MNTYSGNYETPLEKTQVGQNCKQFFAVRVDKQRHLYD